MNRLIKYSLFGSMLLTHLVDAKSIAIVGAKVHTMSSQGTIDNATVLIKNGKIQSVMQGETALAGYEIIDAKGKVVTPGLIGASTSLGLVDVGFSAGTNDSNSSLTSISKTGAAFDVSYALILFLTRQGLPLLSTKNHPGIESNCLSKLYPP